MDKDDLKTERNKVQEILEDFSEELSHNNRHKLARVLNFIDWEEKRITELEAQIDKMKCCGNCEWKAKGVCNGNDTCGLKEWKLVETRR